MAFAAALSRHPRAAEAVGEVVGSVLDRMGPAPEVAALFLTPDLEPALDDVVAAVRATLDPTVLVGAVAPTVVAGAREVDTGPALVLWAADLPGALPVRLEAAPTPGGVEVRGTPVAAGHGPRTLVLLADPHSLPLEGLLAGLADAAPGLTVVGGLVPGAPTPGGSRMVLDGAVHHDGAVGVLLPGDAPGTPLVSQGCRPVGEPMIVTAAEGPVVLELAGQPALDRLLEVARAVAPDDRARFEAGPQVGVVVDETKATFGTGDFLVRGVVGADPERRGVTVGGHVEVGTTVQFHVRDRDSASEDLRRLLAGVDEDAGGPGAHGALLFTCNGRGRALFGTEDHDAALVASVAGPAVAGMACAGEIGPSAGRNHLHGHTASVLLLRAPG